MVGCGAGLEWGGGAKAETSDVQSLAGSFRDLVLFQPNPFCATPSFRPMRKGLRLQPSATTFLGRSLKQLSLWMASKLPFCKCSTIHRYCS